VIVMIIRVRGRLEAGGTYRARTCALSFPAPSFPAALLFESLFLSELNMPSLAERLLCD